MIFTDDIRIDCLPCFTGYPAANHLSAAVYTVALTDETVLLRLYIVLVLLRSVRTKLSHKALAVGMYKQLIGQIGVIAHTIVEIVVHNGRTCSERHLSAEIGEQIVSVVMVMLRYSQLGMQHHPVYEVGKLAQTAAYTLRRTVLPYHHAL